MTVEEKLARSLPGLSQLNAQTELLCQGDRDDHFERPWSNSTVRRPRDPTLLEPLLRPGGTVFRQALEKGRPDMYATLIPLEMSGLCSFLDSVWTEEIALKCASRLAEVLAPGQTGHASNCP
jgi:hypothetical protein